MSVLVSGTILSILLLGPPLTELYSLRCQTSRGGIANGFVVLPDVNLLLFQLRLRPVGCHVPSLAPILARLAGARAPMKEVLCI